MPRLSGASLHIARPDACHWPSPRWFGVSSVDLDNLILLKRHSAKLIHHVIENLDVIKSSFMT
jgi:hypothetical protein